MEKGDHLISARIGYSHHGIYIGRNKVIHYSGGFVAQISLKLNSPKPQTDLSRTNRRRGTQ